MFLQGQMGVKEGEVLTGVRKDVEAKKFHIACNRVFESKHKEEIKREKDAGRNVGETIIHPNEYFVRSFELKNPGEAGKREEEVVDTPMM